MSRSKLSMMKVSKAVWDQLDEKNVSLIAAGIAFFSIFAIFPGLAAMISIWGLLADPALLQEQIDTLQGIVPQDVFALLDQQINKLSSAGRTSLGWTTALSIFVALWSARAGVGALMQGLNTMYGESNRGVIRHYFSATIMTFSLIGVTITAAACIVVIPVLIAAIPFETSSVVTLNVLRWIIAISVITMGLSIVYRFGPNRRSKGRAPWLTPGAFLVVVFWVAASAAFSAYLSNFGRYNEVYGSIGAVIALLMWLYISAFLVLMGGAINAQIELHRDNH